MQFYDIIGDIHGHAEQLLALLYRLDYKLTKTGYKHKNRKIIFLGDFIDRGEHLGQHRQLLDIVIPMVRNGHALAVMGNHEFNALAYHTQYQGHYLRLHTESNTRQHQAFLNEFESESELKQSVLDFFYELPLWLDMGNLRVVHACWHQKHIEALQSQLSDNRLTEELLIHASTEGHWAYESVETLLKGIESPLPAGYSFKDKDGHIRNVARIKWWVQHTTSLEECLLESTLSSGEFNNISRPENLPEYRKDEPPCFIGHYWLNGTPKPLTDNIACLDYSVAKGGSLIAYRWEGEQILKQENFIGCELI